VLQAAAPTAPPALAASAAAVSARAVDPASPAALPSVQLAAFSGAQSASTGAQGPRVPSLSAASTAAFSFSASLGASSQLPQPLPTRCRARPARPSLTLCPRSCASATCAVRHVGGQAFGAREPLPCPRRGCHGRLRPRSRSRCVQAVAARVRVHDKTAVAAS